MRNFESWLELENSWVGLPVCDSQVPLDSSYSRTSVVTFFFLLYIYTSLSPNFNLEIVFWEIKNTHLERVVPTLREKFICSLFSFLFPIYISKRGDSILHCLHHRECWLFLGHLGSIGAWPQFQPMRLVVQSGGVAGSSKFVEDKCRCLAVVDRPMRWRTCTLRRLMSSSAVKERVKTFGVWLN